MALFGYTICGLVAKFVCGLFYAFVAAMERLNRFVVVTSQQQLASGLLVGTGTVWCSWIFSWWPWSLARAPRRMDAQRCHSHSLHNIWGTPQSKSLVGFLKSFRNVMKKSMRQCNGKSAIAPLPIQGYEAICQGEQTGRYRDSNQVINCRGEHKVEPDSLNCSSRQVKAMSHDVQGHSW